MMALPLSYLMSHVAMVAMVAQLPRLGSCWICLQPGQGRFSQSQNLCCPLKNSPKITLIRSQKGNLPVLAFVRQQAGSQENLHFSPSKLSQIVHVWVIPSEKTEKNWPPLKVWFFGSIVTTGLVIDDLGHFWTPGAPWGPWGALGGFWGVWRTQNCPFPHGTNFDSEMSCFGSKQLVTLCFWYFGPNLGPQGQKRPFWAKIGYAEKCIFPKSVISNLAYIAPKRMLGTIF